MKELDDYNRIINSERGDYKNIPFINKECDLTVTYVLPLLNVDSYYKMITQAMALNRYSKKIRTFMLGLQEEQFDKQIEDYDVYLQGEIVAETDIFVFPFTTQRIKPIIQAIIDYKSSAKICMIIDQDWVDVPVHRKEYAKFQDPDVLKRIVENIRDVDAVFFFNNKLEDKVFDRVSAQIKGSNTLFATIPMLTDLELIADCEINPNKDQEFFNIGILAGINDWENNSYIRDVLKTIQKKHKNVQVYAIGNGIVYDGKNCLKDVNYKQIVYANILDYFHKISSLKLNCAIIPIKDTAYNSVSFDYSSYITFSILQIPIFASDVYPINKVINNNERGVLCAVKNNWIDELELAIKDQSKITEIMKMAFSVTREYFIFNTPDKIKLFEEIFTSL